MAQTVRIINREETVRVQPQGTVRVVQNRPIIQVIGGVMVVDKVVTFRPFSFVATQDQEQFTLPSNAQENGLFSLAIDATPQNQAAGDFTFEGNILTIPGGLDAGTTVYGNYQEA